MRKKLLAGSLAAVLAAVNLGPAVWAQQSPEFARTAEEWAGLRDNKLEYGEIAGLVHEYNNTVLKNAIAYRDEKDDDSDDIADDYYDAADELEGSVSYPDSTSASFASELSSWLNSQAQADSMREQGDDNVDDASSKKLGYEQTEAKLTRQAQELMIDYWSQSEQLESARAAAEQAQTSYESAQVKQSAGMATAADVMTAKESADSAAASVLTAESTLAQTKENLCLMLGWSYGAEVELGSLPQPDLEAIEAIDLASDVQKGLEKNYSLAILNIQVTNAKSTTNREKLEQSLKSGKETVSTSISSAYQELLNAKSDYEQAQGALATAEGEMATAERKQAAGMLSRNDYERQKSAYTSARVTAVTAENALLKAQNAYSWAVNGLADSGQ